MHDGTEPGYRIIIFYMKILTPLIIVLLIIGFDSCDKNNDDYRSVGIIS
jgi:hypothetical protein